MLRRDVSPAGQSRRRDVTPRITIRLTSSKPVSGQSPTRNMFPALIAKSK